MLINFTSAKNVLNILPYFFVYLNIIIANISNAYCPKEFRFILFSCPNIFSNLSWLLLLFHLLHQNNYKCYIIPCLPTGQSNIKSVQQTSVWIHPRICSFYAVPFFIQYIVKQIAFFPPLLLYDWMLHLQTHPFFGTCAWTLLHRITHQHWELIHQ